MMHFNDPFAGNGAKASNPLVALAEDIFHYARTVSDYFDANHLPQPSFELDGPEDYSNELPDEIHEARAKLRGAATDLGTLAAGPKASLMWMVWNYHDVSSLHYVHHFHIAEAVPLAGSMPIEEIAAVTNTPLGGVRTEETGPAAFGLVAAAERWGGDAQELQQTPYSHVHSNGKLSRFEVLAVPENRGREIRFGKLMKALQSTEAYDLKHTVTGYPWQDLGEGALVVDVGSNTGATAQALVEHHPNLHVVVQDLPGVVSHGRKLLPAGKADRIKFMDYSFLEQTQPVPDAAAYCFRQIFHDWPDKYAVQALRNTASVMVPGQKMIIVDVVMPPPGSTLKQIESQLRRSDMEMMVQFNALEREAVDWEALIKNADHRLEIRSIRKPPGSANTIIEIVVGIED